MNAMTSTSTRRFGGWREFLTSYGLPGGGILVLAVLFTILEPSFFQSSTLFTIFRESAVLLVVGIGLTFVILMGSIDLSVGSTVTLAGLASALVAKDGSWWAAILVGIAVGIAVGALNGVIFAYAKVPSFLTTLGVALVVSGVGLWIVGGRPVQLFNDAFTNISQAKLVGELSNLALWAFIIWVLFTWVGLKTRFGRYAYAIGGAEAVSGLAGIPIKRMKFYALTLCGGLAGVAGVLLTARIGAATPDMGARLTLDAIAAVVIGGTALTGGVGGVHRTIFGVLLITTLIVGLNVIGIAPFLQDIIQGSVVVLAVALTLDRSKLSILK